MQKEEPQRKPQKFAEEKRRSDEIKAAASYFMTGGHEQYKNA